MREKLQSITYLFDFEYLYSFRRYSPSNFEVVQNHANFLMFWPLKFCCEGLQVLDRNYEIKHISHRGAKFRGDGLTDLGDLTTGKNKCQQNISPLQ